MGNLGVTFLVVLLVSGVTFHFFYYVFFQDLSKYINDTNISLCGQIFCFYLPTKLEVYPYPQNLHLKTGVGHDPLFSQYLPF